MFVDRFYFGCEADDPANAWAFSRRHNPGGVQLNALYGSDIGHFDVPDMREVLAEAIEPFDDGIMSPSDFRDFVFTNAATFYTDTNAGFFEGTVIEDDVAALSHA